MSNTSSSHDKAPNFRPASLRWPLLVSFALYICALIVGIEYLIRVFPSAEDKGSIPEDTPPDRSFIPLVSIPLANIGQPTPRPDPSIIPKFSKRVEPPRIHRRTVRRVRSAADTTDSYNATKPIYNNGTEPSPDSNSTPPSGAITDEEKLLIDWAERTGKPITFGGRAAYSPFIYGNESTPGNGTAPQLQRRHQAPSRYAQLSGPVQIVVPMVYVWYSDDGVPVEGTSTIVYVGTEEVTDEPYCYAICDGSAIVFRELDCWQWWVKSALYEADSRAGNGSAVWLVQEQLQLGATSCQVRPGVAEPDLPEDGTPGRTPVGVGLPPKPPARVVVETLKDADGRPTATQTMFISTLPPMISTATLLDSKGAPTATVTIGPTPRPTRIVTLTDSRGLPSITLTWSPPLTTLTLRDLQGRATATLTVDASPTSPPFITLSNSLGNPTATIPIAIPTRSVPPKYTDQNPLQSQHHPLSSLEYSLAVFLPLLLCAPLAILSQIVSSDLKALLPFHALAASKDGSLANHSLLLSTGGIYGVLSGFRLLFQQGEGLSLLSDGLIVTSAVVTALASEAVGVVLRGRCAANDFSGCYLGVAVFGKASRAVQVGLSVLLVVVVLMGMLLVRWKTGVGEGPLSLAMTASLARDEEVRGLLQRVEVDCGDDGGEVIGRRELEKVFGRRRFVLGCAGGEKEDQTYGIVIKSEPEAESKLSYDIGYDLGKGREQRKPWLPRCLTRQPTTDVVTLCGTTLLCGLLALVLYYETTQADSGFEDFMNDQNFGARILFAGLGVVISLFWGEYYSSISRVEPYRALVHGSQPAQTSIMVSPATTVFTGLTGAVVRKEYFIVAVGTATVISEFLPILLALIPFSPAQTWETHRVCAWMAVGFLGYMIAVLGFGIAFVRYPYMPVDPASLAGRIYYICDSGVVDDCYGSMSWRDWACREKRYRFGTMVGLSGGKRVGVEYHGDNRESLKGSWKV